MQQQTQQVLQPAVQFQQSIQHQPPVQPQKQKTATDDLFDAFQSAPVQQVNSNSNAKSSILSLYGNTAQPRPASFASFPNQQSNNPSFGNMPQFNAPQQSAQSSGMSDFAGMSDFSFPKQTNKPAGMSDFSGLDFSPQKASIQSTGSNFGFPAGNAQGISSQGMSGMNSFGTPNQGIPVMNNFGTPNQGIPGMNSFGTPNQGIPGMNNFGTPNQGIPGMNNFGSPTQSTGGFSAGSMQSNQGLQSSQNFSSTMQPQKTSPSNGIPDFMNFGAKNAVGNTKPSTGGASTSNMDWGDFQ